jgi:hypothetical protein
MGPIAQQQEDGGVGMRDQDMAPAKDEAINRSMRGAQAAQTPALTRRLP